MTICEFHFNLGENKKKTSRRLPIETGKLIVPAENGYLGDRAQG